MERHGTVRGLILPEIIKYLMDEFQWDENEALDRFYVSEVGKAFADNDTGLYGMSPLYIASIFINAYAEHNTK